MDTIIEVKGLIVDISDILPGYTMSLYSDWSIAGISNPKAGCHWSGSGTWGGMYTKKTLAAMRKKARDTVKDTKVRFSEEGLKYSRA